MKYFLLAIILLHGVIHLFGFLKAFNIFEFKELSLPISKKMGIVWLLAFVLFVVVALLYAFDYPLWWVWGGVAILASQIILFTAWSDAKAGTLPNVLILIACILAYGEWEFKIESQQAIDTILAGTSSTSFVVSESMLVDLPKPVSHWLRHSGVVGEKAAQTVHLKQHYLMKTDPKQEDWYKGIAEQYINTINPAFVWTMNMKMMPLVNVAGRDQFQKGKGSMQIKLLSLIQLANAKNNDKIDQGTLQRYLGETVWCPSSIISPYIKWEAIDSCSAKATMEYGGTIGSGIFHFNDDGDFVKFTAMRYMESDEQAQTIEWVIDVQETKSIHGVRIPTKCSATWRLPEKDWTWAKLEITEISYE